MTMMDYDAALDASLQRLHDEGRYRTFIDIERAQGQFPACGLDPAGWHARRTSPSGAATTIWAWASIREVLAAMHEALEATGAGSGGTRNISGTTVYHKRLEAETGRSAWQGGGAGLHQRLHRQ